MTEMPEEESSLKEAPSGAEAGGERAPGSCRCSACGKWFVPEEETTTADSLTQAKDEQDPQAEVGASNTYDSDGRSDEEKVVCPECTDRRTAMWVVGLFLLFFCFVVLPLLIQIFGTPRPSR